MFKQLAKLSASTVTFMTLSILLSFTAIFMENSTKRLELMIMAVLFFVLFTYSLLSDKIKEIRAKKNE
jgi:hypothetical protein